MHALMQYDVLMKQGTTTESPPDWVTVPITVRIPWKDRAALDAKSRESGKGISALAAEMIHEALA
jgi:hypothetical protein